MTTEPCGTCRGDGYLYDQGYWRYEIPDGAIPIQRCDECSVFEGDRDAAEVAAKRETVLGLLVGWHQSPGGPYGEITSAGDVWITPHPEDAGPLELEEEDE